MSNESYQAERNALIPVAVKFANKYVGFRTTEMTEAEKEKWAADWNRTFHRRMNKLYDGRSQVKCPKCGGKGTI